MTPEKEEKTVFEQTQITDKLKYSVSVVESYGQYRIRFSVQEKIYLEADVLSEGQEREKINVLYKIIEGYEEMKERDEVIINKLKNQIR